MLLYLNPVKDHFIISFFLDEEVVQFVLNSFHRYGDCGGAWLTVISSSKLNFL